MADWLYERGVDPVFIDNYSDYSPLLEFYKNSPYQVIRLYSNFGHTVVWNETINILRRLKINGRYIVTDPDLDLNGVPDDFLDMLNRGLELYPVDKCALSLEINDLPNSAEGIFIRAHEAKYWKDPFNDLFFKADTDTTFALYRAGTKYTHSAVRTNRPYTCRHIPWYYTDFNLLSDEEKHYFITANNSSSGKARLII